MKEEKYLLNKEERQSNFELLRIISMILIVAHHYAVHGGFEITEKALSLNKIWIQILSLGGKFGINIFILITGYFMINSKFNIKKLIKLIFQVMCYTILSYVLLGLTGIVGFSSRGEMIKGFLKAVLPIPYQTYSFVTAYVIIYLLSPYINILIKKMNQKQILKLILLGIVMWSIFPTFLNADFSLSGNQIIWFTLLYIIGGYIRLYPFKANLSNKSIIKGIGIYLLIVISVIVFDILGIRWNIFNDNATYFANYYSFFLLLSSIYIFNGFKNIDFKSKVVNSIATLTFGVYLLHDNYFMREFIWEKLLKVNTQYNSSLLLVKSIITIVLVFSICCFIDYIRCKLLEKPFMKVINNKWEKLKKLFHKLASIGSYIYIKYLESSKDS